jgi:hypothetical protein
MVRLIGKIFGKDDQHGTRRQADEATHEFRRICGMPVISLRTPRTRSILGATSSGNRTDDPNEHFAGKHGHVPRSIIDDPPGKLRAGHEFLFRRPLARNDDQIPRTA